MVKRGGEGFIVTGVLMLLKWYALILRVTRTVSGPSMGMMGWTMPRTSLLAESTRCSNNPNTECILSSFIMFA